MGIALAIAVLMMFAMEGNPGDRRTFACQGAEPGEQPANWAEGLETAMGEQAMIPQANPQAAEEPAEDQGQQDPRPGEEEGSRQGAEVNHGNPDHHRPVEPLGPTPGGGRAFLLDRLSLSHAAVVST